MDQKIRKIRMRKPAAAVLCVGISFYVLCAGGCGSKYSSMDKQITRGVHTILDNIREPHIPDRTMNLIEFSGHKPDEGGTYEFREDIQKAIDTLAGQGGGKLVFAHTEDASLEPKPVVIYRVKGPIMLKSNIELSFEPSVKLQFEFDPSSHRPGGKGVLSRYEGTTLYTHSPLIRAFNVQNIAITTDRKSVV